MTSQPCQRWPGPSVKKHQYRRACTHSKYAAAAAAWSEKRGAGSPGAGQRAVVGSITAATGVMRLAGKPDLVACSRISASLGAL